jgi:sulfonate transport system substrate-binding protein
VLAGCGGSSDASQTAPVPARVSAAALKNVTLRVGDQKGNSAQALLKAAGLLGNVPYTIQWSTFTSGPPMLEAANAGAVDIGQVGNTPPIVSAAGKGNIDVVAVERSPVGDAILVPKNSGLHSLADLRGRTIAVAQGSSGNGTLLSALNKAGLKPSDVKISYLQPADAYAAFSQNQVDAWAVWQPYVSQAVLDLGARQLVSGQNSISGSGAADGTALSNGYSMQVASRAALADAGKNTAIADYVVRIAKAYAWARQNPAKWAALYASETGLPANVAQGSAPDISLTAIPLDSSVISSEQTLADRFTAAGQVPKVDFAKFVDQRFDGDLRTYLDGAK